MEKTLNHNSIFSIEDSINEFRRDNFVGVLYLVLSVFTYVYLTLAVAVFVFQNELSSRWVYVVDLLSDPYIMALGIYVIAKEFQKVKKGDQPRRWGELFVTFWILFFTAASFLTIFSEAYEFNQLYKIVTTNSLAALIIRIGTLLR